MFHLNTLIQLAPDMWEEWKSPRGVWGWRKKGASIAAPDGNQRIKTWAPCAGGGSIQLGKCLFVGKSTSYFRKLSCFVMLIQHCNQIPTGQALEKASRGAAASSQASSILFELLSSGKKMQSHKMQIELLQELICCCLLLTALEAWISRSSISPQGACFNS